MSTVQASIFGDTDHTDVADIETNGRILRPLLALPNAVVDEMKLHVDEDGLRATAVDPANVVMAQFHATPAAFDTYDVETSAVVGLNLDRLRKRAERARMRKNDPDPITLDLDERRALVTTEREYVDTTVRQTDQLQLIDPDSIREEPDVPDFQEEHGYRATVDVDAFADTIHNLDASGDHVELAEDDGALTLTVDGDDKSLADFGHVAEPTHDHPTPGASSTFSNDYLKDIATGLKKAKVDDVTVTWGDEFPVFIDFARTIQNDDGDDSIAYGGKYILAPRVAQGDDA
jgi:hypothetical protein